MTAGTGPQRRPCVPDTDSERYLDRLLGYGESDPGGQDAFATAVMQRVRNQKRQRAVVLTLFGVAGALFGVLGAAQLMDPIARLFAGASPTVLQGAVLLSTAVIAFYAWFMNEDISLAV